MNIDTRLNTDTPLEAWLKPDIERRAKRYCQSIAEAQAQGSQTAIATTWIMALSTAQARLAVARETIAEQQVALDELAARIAALEAQPKSAGVLWAGVYVNGRRYMEGQLVTRGGSLWLAKNSTTETPGASPSWVLVCKSGQVPER